jgi:hypothetical protein
MVGVNFVKALRRWQNDPNTSWTCWCAISTCTGWASSGRHGSDFDGATSAQELVMAAAD